MTVPRDNSAKPGITGVNGEVADDRFVGDRDLTRWKSRFGQWAASWFHRAAKRLGPHAALILILAVGLIVAVALTLLSAHIYDAVTEANDIAALDQPLLSFAMSLRSPGLDTAMTLYTDIAGTIGMPIIAIVTLLILSIHRRSWTPSILITAAGIGSLAMTIAGKDLIGRARPPLVDAVAPYEYSPSFPSGHTLNAVVIAGIIAYLLMLRQTTHRARVLTSTLAISFAFTIGASRVYLGHHWFTDVLVAITLGLSWLAIIITAHRLYLTSRQRRTKTLAPPRSRKE